MPLYYFHFEDGTPHGDPEGTELPDVEAARRHAAAFLDPLIRATRAKLGAGDSLQLRVTDETGRVCCSLQFAPVGAAAGGIAAYRERAEQAFPHLTSAA